MKRKTILKLFLGIAAFILLLKLLTILFLEPWIGKKLQARVLEMDNNFVVEIEDVYILFLKAGIELKNIHVNPKSEVDSTHKLKGEVESIKFTGISLYKAIFYKEFDIGVLTISNGKFNGKIKMSEAEKSPTTSSKNIHIDKIAFEKVDFNITSTSSAQSYIVKDGSGTVLDLEISKDDTLYINTIKHFDFKAKEVRSVSSDSLYALKGSDVVYSEGSGKLSISEFSIHPNYKKHDFAAQSKFQTDRIEAVISNIVINDFSAIDYLKSASIASSYVEIEKLKMEVFRDKRKVFKHEPKPTFQDLIYNYPGRFNIDSLALRNGNITYLERVENSNRPGKINFEEINARIYKISNDTTYKKEEAFLELKAEALLMGISKIEVSLKSKIFDRNNSFTVKGSLSSLSVKELNPILENIAFISATSGKIDAMLFNFLATNNKSSGKLSLLYHGLKVEPQLQQETPITPIKELIYTIITRNKILESNPLPGDKLREGKIEFERDPEKFLFNYCFKSILSGIKSSLIK